MASSTPLDGKVACLACTRSNLSSQAFGGNQASSEPSTSSNRLHSNDLCDGRYPCTPCYQTGTNCFYPPPRPDSSSRDERRSDFDRWSHELSITPGTFAAAKVEPQYDPKGKVKSLRWKEATEQRQDLRIRPNPTRPPIRRITSTILDQDAAEANDEAANEFSNSTKAERLNQYTYLQPDNPFHPSILLSAIIADQPPVRGRPSDVNLDNCLGTTQISLEDGTLSTCVAWRAGAASSHHRGTTLAWAQSESSSTLSRLRPTTQPLFTKTHTSPITQVGLIGLPETYTALLGSRSMTHFTLQHLSISSTPQTNPTILSSFSYSSSHLKHRPIASFALSSYTPGQGVLVDTFGNLFGFGLGVRGSGRIGDSDWKGDQPEMFRLRKGNGIDGGEFRKAQWGNRGDEVLVASENEVVLYDLRSPKSALILYTNSNKSAPISSIITPLPSTSPSSYTAISTALSPITILDSRLPSHPIMSFPTSRIGPQAKGFDHTLSLHNVPSLTTSNTSDDIWRIALSSRLHSGLEFYTFDNVHGGLVTSVLDPYFVESDDRTEELRSSRAGLGFAGERGGWRMIECSRKGELIESGIKLPDVDGDENVEMEIDVAVDWIGETGPGLEQGEGDAGEVAKAERVDGLTALKDRLFERRDDEEEQPFWDVEDAMDAGVSLDGKQTQEMNTLYEILSRGRATDQQEMIGDSLYSSSLPKPRLDEAGISELVRQDTLLSERSELHLQHFSSTSAPAEAGSLAALSELYDLPPSLTSSSISHYSRALQQRYNASPSSCDQLSLDLALSNRIFSAQSITPNPPPPSINRPLPADAPSDADLKDGVPDLHFSYFKPEKKSHFAPFASQAQTRRLPEVIIEEEGEDDEEGTNSAFASLGVRRIASEWHLGTDPSSYFWENPYVDEDRDGGKKKQNDAEQEGEEFIRPPPSSGFRVPKISSSQTPFGSQSQKPRGNTPFITIQDPSGRSKRLVEITDPLPSESQSQFAGAATQPNMGHAPSSSQEIHSGTASQTVPGAFGSRPSMFGKGTADKAKKKAGKKRISGF